MAEKIDHIQDNDQEKLFEELENMNLIGRIDDQRSFLKMYFDSKAYENTLRNELYVYDMLISGGHTIGEMNLVSNISKLSDEGELLFKSTKNSRKICLDKIKAKLVKLEDSAFGGISLFGSDNPDKSLNIKGQENDSLAKMANKMDKEGELGKFDILLNDKAITNITDPIHEMYHVLSNVSGVGNNEIIGQYTDKITLYFKDIAKINIVKDFKEEYLDYIFQLDEIRSTVIETKYILHKLNLRNIGEEISQLHMDKLAKIAIDHKYPKLTKTINELLLRIRIVSGSLYDYNYIKKTSGSLDDLEYAIEVEEGSKLLLKVLMNNIASNQKVENKLIYS